MKIVKKFTVVFVVLTTLSVFVTPAQASGQSECAVSPFDGIWFGSTPDEVGGGCESQFLALLVCGDASWFVDWHYQAPGTFQANPSDCHQFSNFGTSPVTGAVGAGRGSLNDSTRYNEETITLHLGGGKNGNVTFAPGTCLQLCSISPTLPTIARNSLPAHTLATLYVRMVDEAGTAGEGSYLICFDNPHGDTLTIYRYIRGAWLALRVSASDPICTTASGDGAFSLGG